jgi:iron complex outermembrane receptor protein
MKIVAQGLLLVVALGASVFGEGVMAQQRGAGTAVEEIVVTAQKRTQSLAEVPIAISVFGSEAIDQTGVQELRELGEYIPNVIISQGSDFGAAILIRGVGANSRNIGFDSRVGVYLDGVYLGQGPALNQDLVDLDRIEVLRGPQGTLFGNNTVAGAVSMISVKPDSEFSADVTANVANYNGLELKGVVNIPFSETVSGRISVSHRERDGFVSNVWDASHVPTTMNAIVPGVGPVFGIPLCDSFGGTTPPGCAAGLVGPDAAPDASNKMNNQDTQSWRAQLRFQPNEKLDINFAFDGLESDREALLGEPLTDTFGSTVDRFSPNYVEVSFSERSWETRDIFGASMNIDYAF